MIIYKLKDYAEMSKKAALIIASQVNLKPNSVLGLATGSTPVETYKQIIKLYKDGNVDFEKVVAFNLDEYKGLKKENDQSYHYFMRDNLFNHININPNNTHIPDGSNMDAKHVCEEYENKINNLGPIDLQVLGIGLNGHIGFNEPDEHFTSKTNLVKLTKSTIDANSRFFDNINDVPTEAYTMGIGSIMKAKCIMLLASGESKADIIAQSFKGKITPLVPASILQMHPNVILIGDEAALSKLN